MKKTAIAIATMTLILVGTTLAQPRQRPTRQIGNPIGLGGTVTAGVKNRQPAPFHKRTDKGAPVANLGDTGTHEVGHKGKLRNGQFRPNPNGDGTTQQFRKSGTSEQNRTNQPLSMKLGDIAGESKVARTEAVTNNEFKSKRPFAGGSDDGQSIRGRNPRQRSNQKRQHLPCKRQDCK